MRPAAIAAASSTGRGRHGDAAGGGVLKKTAKRAVERAAADGATANAARGGQVRLQLELDVPSIWTVNGHRVAGDGAPGVDPEDKTQDARCRVQDKVVAK